MRVSGSCLPVSSMLCIVVLLPCMILCVPEKSPCGVLEEPLCVCYW